MPRAIILSENSKITEKMADKLDELITFSPPHEMQQRILEVYLQFIIKCHEELPNDFEDIACDFYMLSHFLNELDTELNYKDDDV